ncbi:MAG: hypothetical protein SFU20_05400 [Chitinophagaceae bacterium]|nr:hypothetical protein [Chitinophagaceae bacterium]
MKKTGFAILLFLYFAFSSGIVINLHYCMGRFDSVQIGNAPSEYCGKCGMHTDFSNGCCHDEVRIIKIADDQQPSSTVQLPLFTALIQPEQPVYLEPVAHSVLDKVVYKTHSPPLHKQDTYLVNGVFRI